VNNNSIIALAACVQAVATVVLACITIYYAYQAKKSAEAAKAGALASIKLADSEENKQTRETQKALILNHLGAGWSFNSCWGQMRMLGGLLGIQDVLVRGLLLELAKDGFVVEGEKGVFKLPTLPNPTKRRRRI